ncbi:MAG: VOC family protein [Caldilineaceae bacterium]
MNLGTFSVSLAVADLPASRAFYEKLGFEAIDGQPDEGWIILRNGDTHIGLFQKMFEKNILTFNPTDVRHSGSAQGTGDPVDRRSCTR